MVELAIAPALVVGSIGWALLHFLWQGAAIAALYALGRLLLQGASPRAKVTLGHAALLALALAPLATFTIYLLGALSLPTATVGADPLQAVTGVASFDGNASSISVLAAIEAALPWLVGAWLIGVLVLSARGVRQWRALRRLCAVALPADPFWQERLVVLCARMGVRRVVQLRECALVVAPMLVGWLKPVILLPASLCTRLPAEQIEMLLAHELAHVRRLDYLANLLQMVLETALFYHPAVHWISRCVRDDRELCCDDLVTGIGAHRLSYARALLTLAEQHVEMRHAPALAATGGALLARIERIVDAPRSSAAPAAATTPLLVLAGAIALAALGLRAFVPTPADPSPAPLPALGAADVAVPALRLAVADLPLPMLTLPPLSLATPLTATSPVDSQQRSDDRTGLSTSGAALASAGDSSPAMQGGTLAEPVLPVLASAAAASTVTPLAGPAMKAPAAATPAPAPAAGLAPRSAPIAASPVATASAAAGQIVPLEVRAPEYPQRARVAGIEGHVTLSYSIGSDGRVTEVRIEDATPPRTFNRAALEALDGWRFAAGAGAGLRLQQTFDFVLGGGAARSEDCIVATGSRLCRPRP